MNRRSRLFHTAAFVLLAFSPGLSLECLADPPSGIQPLESLPHSRIPFAGEPIRTLFTAADQERFLNELEKQPPDWNQLHDPPGEELGARLFAFNRQRDALREGHPLMSQRVAFWWSGVLGEYREADQGFSVVMGPKFTKTTWGLVRFKPRGLPHTMVAVPSASGLRTLLDRYVKGERVEIGILFTGTLIPWESIIYAFSHDGTDQGLIMPVVQVEGVRYFLRPLSD